MESKAKEILLLLSVGLSVEGATRKFPLASLDDHSRNDLLVQAKQLTDMGLANKVVQYLLAVSPGTSFIFLVYRELVLNARFSDDQKEKALASMGADLRSARENLSGLPDGHQEVRLWQAFQSLYRFLEGYHALSIKHRQLEAEVELKAKLVDTLEKQCDDCWARVNSFNAHMKSLSTRRQNLENENENLAREIQKLREEYSQAKGAMAAEIRLKEQQVSGLAAQIPGTKDTLEKLLSDIAEKKAVYQRLQDEIPHEEARLERLREQVREAEKETTSRRPPPRKPPSSARGLVGDFPPFFGNKT